MIGRVVVAVILIMTFAAPVFAGPKSPGVDRREHKQKQRIKQGIKSGALTKEEGRALTAEQKAIRAKEREMKSDGSLTREERKELHQDLNEASKNIADDDPITDGFRKSLPPPHARTVVWGGHPSATGTAVSWLQRQGLRIVERSKLQKVLDEQTIRLTHTSDDEAQVLRVGKLLGAEVVVFIDSPVTGGHQSSGGAYGNIAASGSATVYSTSIWVRGVDIESG